VSPVNNPHFQYPPPPSAGLAREMSKCIGSVVGCVLGAGVTACRAPCSRVRVRVRGRACWCGGVCCVFYFSTRGHGDSLVLQV
jgi:hypothetical protein